MKIIVLLFSLMLPLGLVAQLLSGQVTNTEGTPLVGANIILPDQLRGTSTDANGQFVLPFDPTTSLRVIATYVGYESDTVIVDVKAPITIQLQAMANLEEVVVRQRKEGVSISQINPIKTESISTTELKKAACCDLSGCFETQTTVNPQTTNVITNAKELRILGLSGVYNQLLVNGLPMIQGLSYTYGISSIPGAWVENIHIAKGANSVAQGFESISGQINVETLAPERAKPLFINAYINSFGEKHLNLLHRFRLGSWTALTSLHSVQPARRVDRDDDRFMDLPLLRRYLVGQQWSYGNKQTDGWHSQLGVRWLWENRIGGQLNYHPDNDLGSRLIYGQSVQIQQPEWWTKTGYRFNKNHQLVLLAAAFQQQQDTYFGFVNYKAQQTSAYANIQHEWMYNDQHDLKTGISFRYLNLREDIGFDNDPLQRTYAGQYQRKDIIPGCFIENTLRLAENRITWITGLRVDNHQEFGTRITPRSLIKYDFSANTTVRASIGSGWRVVNFFSENIALLASSRNLLFTEPLAPEQAVNMGLNLTHKYATDKVSGYLSMDFYRTHFSNQIFPDYDTDPRLAIVQNFRGLSASNGFQADFVIRALQRLEFKAGYNYLDVYREQEQIKQELPFNPKHKLISSISYHPLSNRFQIDANFHRYGKQRLPDTSLNPTSYQRPNQSDAFTIINLQFTLRFNTLEWYAGCENIFDFRQLRPIISWQDPFGPYFDTSSVWGPTRGREFYIGARYTLADKD